MVRKVLHRNCGICMASSVFTKMTDKIQVCRIICCSLTALHVSSNIFAYNQEHLNCMYSFWYYSHMSFLACIEVIKWKGTRSVIFKVPCIMIQFTKMTNKLQLCRIIYCSLTALHVSSNIFAHHQEYLNCMYNFWYYYHVSLQAATIPAGNATWE
jgi:hypothetical protein